MTELWGLSIHPMLTLKEETPFTDPAWIFEVKWDGTRALCFYEDGKFKLQNRRLYDTTYRYPDVRIAAKAKRAIFDGEVVIMWEGRPSFEMLQRREHLASAEDIARIAKKLPATYVAFDILYLDGQDLTAKPLMERKEILADVFENTESAVITDYVEQEGEAFYRVCRERGLEGIIAKRKDSRYLIGRRASVWKKIKALKTVDCVIAGVTVGEGNRADTFGALILGLYDEGGVLHCVGRVGTGFDRGMVELLDRRLAAIQGDLPFPERPDLAGEVKFWCRPEIVAEVEYLMFTPDVALRAPSFQRLKEDKEARECVFPPDARRPSA
ncbi:MAG TPA: non-homologous end-joining DNA ligase [Thermoplasmata archaeon]|nr:non-homologous end-joining DNA ligase [Thermoplasmata archaeon]